MFNKEADAIGRYYIFVKTVLLVLVEDFTSMLLFVGFSPSRSYRLALDWEINAGMEIERFGVRFAVLPSNPRVILHDGFWDCRFTLAMIYDRIWDCRFTLAITAYFGCNLGCAVLPRICDICPGPVVSRIESAVCDTVVIDTGLRRSGFSCLGFSIMWRGIIVPD